MRLGVISDTHGLLREAALAELAGADHVVHAGDIGRPDLLERLRGVAPVTAVWGNVDGRELREALPEVAIVELDEVAVVVAHHRAAALDAASSLSARPCLVVFGHSHRASLDRRRKALLLNPGSAGPRRFGLPATLALARVERGEVDAWIVALGD